jgi:hypothetical protein
MKHTRKRLLATYNLEALHRPFDSDDHLSCPADGGHLFSDRPGFYGIL